MIKLFFICICIASSLFGNEKHSKIFSTSDLQQIEAEVEKLEGEVFVLFDIDTTLIVPDDAILRPAGEKLLDSLLGGNKVQDLPSGRRYPFREILLQASHSRVDDRSLGVVQRLQEKGATVIAFTAAPRGKIGPVENVADWKIEELSRFGFDFSSAFSNLGTIELPKDPDKEFSPLFKKGILFASLHSKGATLSNFLHTIGYQPKHIVLIDDQMKYIDSVSRAAADLGTDFIGFHYTAAEKLPCALDPDLAAWQVRTFLDRGEWKNDAEIRWLDQMQPKVIYFDFGGVMAQPDTQMQLGYLAATVGLPKESIEDSPHFRWMQLHPAEIDYLSQIAQSCQIDLTPEMLENYRQVKRNSVREIPGMPKLVETLRQNYEVNLITNVRSENLDLIAPFMGLFDHVVHCPANPGERGAVWEMEWTQHGLAPSNLLLIDDQKPNVGEAQQLGIQAIPFQNAEALNQELTQRGILFPIEKKRQVPDEK